MRLSELQRQFGDYLLGGEGASLARAIHRDQFEPLERLAIHRNNFLISLGEALAANFPVTTLMVGREFMLRAARQYVTIHPPRGPRLLEYGDNFSDHLRRIPGLADYPYVPEMVDFEWARILVWDAKREPFLAASDLAALAPEAALALPVRLACHACVLRHRYPIVELWSAHHSADPKLETIELSSRPRASLVCRPGDRILVHALSEREADFLLSLVQPAGLGRAMAFAAGDRAAGAAITIALDHGLLVAAANAGRVAVIPFPP